MTGEVIGSPEYLAPGAGAGPRARARVGPVVAGRAAVRGGRGQLPVPPQDTPLSTLRAVVDEELPPPRRAGPLAPVIEGLLRKDPAERLTADRAEQDLRLIAAGGTPSGRGRPFRTDGARTAPSPCRRRPRPAANRSGHASTGRDARPARSTTPPATSSTAAAGAATEAGGPARSSSRACSRWRWRSRG